MQAALNSPAPDVYWWRWPASSSTFARVLGDPAAASVLQSAAPLVENALKAAFDWKSRHNQAHNRPGAGHSRSTRARAFHGRSVAIPCR